MRKRSNDVFKTSVRALYSRATFLVEKERERKEISHLLFVEGETDCMFFSRVTKKTVKCLSATEYRKARDVLKNIDAKSLKKVTNKNLVNAVTNYHYNIKEVSSSKAEIESVRVFGVVDMDFDFSKEMIQQVFTTDTHDLETMLLKTDDQVLYRLNEIDLKPEEYYRALFMSLQLGYYKKALEDSHSGFSEDDLNDDYGRFFDKRVRMKISDAIKQSIKSRSVTKEQAELKKQKIIDSPTIRDRLDDNGLLSLETKPDSSICDSEETWKYINGHDLLKTLCFINSGCKTKYITKQTKRRTINRSFEEDIINKYQLKKFKNTKLRKHMKEAGLIS